MRDAGSPAQTDTPALHSGASFPSPPSATSSSPCHCFADFSTLYKTAQRSPRPTPTLSGIRDRRLACSVPRVQPALSCRCPSRSKRPRHVGPHKRPPPSGPPRLPLLPRGVPGPRSGARGQLLGVGTSLDKGLARGPSGVRAGWGRSRDARARAPSWARAARTRDALPRTGAPGGIRGLGGAADSAAPPPQPPAQLRQRSGETQLQGPPPRRPGTAPLCAALPSPGPLRSATPIRCPKEAPPTHQAAAPLPRFPGSGRGHGGGEGIHPFAPLSPPPTREGQSRETNRKSPTSLCSGLRRSLRRRRRREHRGVVPARPPPARPDARGGLRGRRGRGARRPRLQPGLPARPFGRRPTCPLPSALPVGHGRQALGSERELFVSPPRLRHRRGGWGREAGLRSPRHRPSPAAPPPPTPTPPPRLLVLDVRLSVRSRTPAARVRSCPPWPARSLGHAPNAQPGPGPRRCLCAARGGGPGRGGPERRSGVRRGRVLQAGGQGLRRGPRPEGTGVRLPTGGPSRGVDTVAFPETALASASPQILLAAAKSSRNPSRDRSCFCGREDTSKAARTDIPPPGSLGGCAGEEAGVGKSEVHMLRVP